MRCACNQPLGRPNCSRPLRQAPPSPTGPPSSYRPHLARSASGSISGDRHQDPAGAGSVSTPLQAGRSYSCRLHAQPALFPRTPGIEQTRSPGTTIPSIPFAGPTYIGRRSRGGRQGAPTRNACYEVAVASMRSFAIRFLFQANYSCRQMALERGVAYRMLAAAARFLAGAILLIVIAAAGITVSVAVVIAAIYLLTGNFPVF